MTTENFLIAGSALTQSLSPLGTTMPAPIETSPSLILAISVYDAREGTSLAEAVAWANSLPGRVTLYLYDEGRGTSRSGRKNQSSDTSGEENTQ